MAPERRICAPRMGSCLADAWWGGGIARVIAAGICQFVLPRIYHRRRGTPGQIDQAGERPAKERQGETAIEPRSTRPAISPGAHSQCVAGPARERRTAARAL